MASSSSRKKASRSNTTPEYDSEPIEGDGDVGSDDDDENDDDDGEEDFDDDDDEDVGRKRKAPAKRPTGSSQIKSYFFSTTFISTAPLTLGRSILFLRLFLCSVEAEKVGDNMTSNKDKYKKRLPLPLLKFPPPSSARLYTHSGLLMAL